MMRSPSWESNKTEEDPVEVSPRTPSPNSGDASAPTVENGVEAEETTEEAAGTPESETFTETITIRHHNRLDDDDDDDDDIGEGSEGRTRPEVLTSILVASSMSYSSG